MVTVQTRADIFEDFRIGLSVGHAVADHMMIAGRQRRTRITGFSNAQTVPVSVPVSGRAAAFVPGRFVVDRDWLTHHRRIVRDSVFMVASQRAYRLTVSVSSGVVAFADDRRRMPLCG